ncbi:MAG: hypothetical protein U0939_14040 [Pirellulales bacterium]
MNALLLPADASGAFHQFARLQSLTEWWQWLLLVAASLGIIAYVVWMYRRDSVDLRRGAAWSLVVLRLLVFLGILFYFFDLERRTERKVVKDSRVALLVDTSQSMGLPDGAAAQGTGPSRVDRVVQELAGGDLLNQLRKEHEVVVYRFDQQPRPVEVASLPKLVAQTEGDPQERAAVERRLQLAESRRVAWVAAACFAIAALASLLALLGLGRTTLADSASWLWLVAIVGGISGTVVLAVATLRTPDFDALVTVGLKADPGPRSEVDAAAENANREAAAKVVDWRAELGPRGTETRLADAIEFLVNKERGGPIAGIVVFSDGGRNAGQPLQLAIEAAQNAGIPITCVGLGSDQRPVNLRVVDLEAPDRVFPGDKFALTGMVQGFGTGGKTAKVELLEVDGETTKKVDERAVLLGPDGEMLPVRFEATPTAPGQVTYQLRASLGSPDHDPKDNEKTAKVEVVERKTKVLLVAGGPAREYQFLKNLLYRDKDTTLHVLLQSGVEGMSQESHELLFDFPDTAEELFEYDAVIGFDPDWEKLDETQAALLERWVAEEGGGLVVVAGPVYTPQWSSRRPGDKVADLVKALYPVAFYYQGAATLSLGRFGGEKPWPIEFTQDGLDAQFLWLGEDATTSQQSWESFEGVFGYYAVKDPKPGAKVYARFGDPDTALDDALPIYMAGHIYGSGRVFFQASGEMWRIRAVDVNYFDQYYTKLVRWASQGRLSRNSKRGTLLVDKDRGLLGDQIGVRAVLKNAQLQPLTDPEAPAVLVSPDGKRTPLKLRAQKEGTRPGLYVGEFTASLEGDYRVELRPAGGDVEELLAKEVRIRVPALEIEKPERNDPLLKELAEKTGGTYFVGMDAALNRDGRGASVAQTLEPQDQTTYLPGTPDRDFERHLMGWLMGLICGVLSLEWLIRRLSKLA